MLLLLRALEEPIRKVVLSVFLQAFAAASATAIVAKVTDHFWPAPPLFGDKKEKGKKK